MNWLIRKVIAAEPGRIPGSLVPDCDPTGTSSTTPFCDMDALLSLGVNFVYTLIGIGFLITVVMVIVGGFRFIVSGGNPERISGARSTLTAAIIGLLIVLTSWVILGYTLNSFVDQERCETLKWYQFLGLQCEGQVETN